MGLITHPHGPYLLSKAGGKRVGDTVNHRMIERVNWGGLVKPDILIELQWQYRLKIVTLKFGFRTIDHSDRSC